MAKAGRPKTGKPSKPLMAFRIRPDLQARVKDLAARQDCSEGQVINSALQRSLGSAPAPQAVSGILSEREEFVMVTPSGTVISHQLGLITIKAHGGFLVNINVPVTEDKKHLVAGTAPWSLISLVQPDAPSQ